MNEDPGSTNGPAHRTWWDRLGHMFSGEPRNRPELLAELRVGRMVLVHDREAYLAALTRIPLDRTAEGTTGGAVDRLGGAGGLFDQEGHEHRRARRDVRGFVDCGRLYLSLPTGR